MGKILCFLFLLTLFTCSEASFTTRGINFWSAPDHTRIVVALKGKATHLKKSRSGRKIIVTFRGRIKGRVKSPVKVEDSIVSKIYVKRTGSLTKLIILLKKRNLNYRVFALRRFRNRPFRIVIDVLKSPEEIRKILTRRIQQVRKARKLHQHIVVIDPGHGGSDPGAIGLYGLMEKDIVLDISRRVAGYCNKDPSIRAFLTRNGDYYISLTRRVEIAHEYGADLFVSIHSNKAPSRKLSGVMAFTLSSRGVRTGLAKMLEDVENAEDIVSDIRLSRKNNGINRAILKVAYDYSVTEGERAAKLITEYVSYTSRMKNLGLRKASLKVLKNPGIPSLLLEIGFLSNRSDASKLRSPAYRDRIAYGICRGIKAFFKFKDRIKKRHYYIVKKGDSLWRIARIYNTSIKELMKANNLKDAVLYPGMKLFIP